MFDLRSFIALTWLDFSSPSLRQYMSPYSGDVLSVSFYHISANLRLLPLSLFGTYANLPLLSLFGTYMQTVLGQQPLEHAPDTVTAAGRVTADSGILKRTVDALFQVMYRSSASAAGAVMHLSCSVLEVCMWSVSVCVFVCACVSSLSLLVYCCD